MNALQLCHWQFSHKETLKQTFFKGSAILEADLCFWVPYSVNRTFFAGVTAEAWRAIIGSKSAISLQRGPADPKFQVEWVTPQPLYFSEN